MTASSAGDANDSSLEGGVLLMTPLYGADGKIYAQAQGPLVVGGYSVSVNGNTKQFNHPTTARVPLGAMVEREDNDAAGTGLPRRFRCYWTRMISKAPKRWPPESTKSWGGVRRGSSIAGQYRFMLRQERTYRSCWRAWKPSRCPSIRAQKSWSTSAPAPW